MRTLEIKKNDANQRLDKFLQKRFKTLPKSLMYKYIRKKCIKVNGKKCDIQTMLKEGDVLTEEFILALPPEQQEIADQINRSTEFKVLRTNYNLF